MPPWTARSGWVLLGAVLCACPKQKTQDPPAPSALAPVLAAWEIDEAALALPRLAETDYRLAIDVPPVRTALAAPLAVIPRVERFAADLDAASPAGLFAALAPLRPDGAVPAKRAADKPGSRSLPSPTELLASTRGKLLTEHLPAAFVAELAGLLVDFEAAAGFDFFPDGVKPLPEAAEAFFVDPWSGASRYRSHPVGPHLAFLDAASAVDQAALAAAAQGLLQAVERRLPALQDAALELPETPGTLLRLDTSLGPIVVGSKMADRHEDDAALLIDPGGDDTWSNNAGGNLGLSGRIALAIDLAGADRYISEKHHVQGAGVLGVGILVDAGDGADEYGCTAQCQGAGFAGIGVVWDRGGDDRWTAEAFAQGAGAFGVGLLIDEGGSDRMRVDARGQGFGAVLGLGVMADLDGDDQRRLGAAGARPSDLDAGGGQGAGWGVRPVPWAGRLALPGGIGVAYDRAGRDVWYARAFGQGHGWFGGMGLLLDRAGDDQYGADLHSIGSASHLAVGIHHDAAGDDRYSAMGEGIGFAADRSLGISVDAGDGADGRRLGIGERRPEDTGPGIGAARGPRALGLVVDEGGVDGWQAVDRGLGWALPEAEPGSHPRAAVLDLGGEDGWMLGGSRGGGSPTDGGTWLHGTLGVGMDTEAEPGWTVAGPWKPEPWTRVESRGEGLTVAPDLDGDAAARWQALDVAYEKALRGEDAGVTVAQAVKLAQDDRDDSVRRAAARLTYALGDLEGLSILVDSLVLPSADNDPDQPAGSLPGFLSLATGLDLGFEPESWRRGWLGIKPEFDPTARWPGVARSELAGRAARRGDLAGLVEHCEAAVAALPGDQAPARRCGAMAGLWAWALSHPDAADPDPRTAVELAQRAALWTPSSARVFVTLGQAWWATGELDLAQRALAKAEVLDPDNVDMLGLRRRMAERPRR